MPFTETRGYVAYASFGGWQQAEVPQLVAVTPAWAARARAEDQYMPDRGLGHAEFECDPVPAVASNQGPEVVQSKRRALGRIQIRWEAEKGLVRVYHRKKVLPVQAMTSGQVTTPVFLFGSLIPGSILLVGQRVPIARGTAKSSPGVVLCDGAVFTALGDVICVHKLMSFLAAA
jgi:hypothetical protein